MERVTDDWLNEAIPKYSAIDSKSKGANVYLALCELRERRQNEISEKDGAGATHEREKAVLPIPIKQVDGVDVKKWTVKQWFSKINEELDEMKEVVLRFGYMNSRVNSDFIGVSDNIDLADEAADTITAITSMLEAMGIDEQQRQAAQNRVNERNKERDRL